MRPTTVPAAQQLWDRSSRRPVGNPSCPGRMYRRVPTLTGRIDPPKDVGHCDDWDLALMGKAKPDLGDVYWTTPKTVQGRDHGNRPATPVEAGPASS